MFEVLEGSQVDIRCGMPLMREPFGDRHFPVKEDLEPVADVAEIDYADYGIAAYAQHFLEQPVRIYHLLQCA